MTNNTSHSLENLEKLLTLLHEVQRVKRVARRPDEQEMTNTAEHTFELAMMCWYIASTNKLDLNLEKILKYALAHDVIEAYAGDTYLFDEEARKTKVAREAAALERLEKEFPEFPDFLSTIHEYEQRNTPESKFVYATDKLIDPLDASMEKIQSIWKDKNVSWDTMIASKKDKIALSDTISIYWKKLVAKLESKKDFFFNN